MLKLPFRGLVEAAHPDIPDALTVQAISKDSNVRKSSMTCEETVNKYKYGLYYDEKWRVS
jgi:hypothetical protein